MKLVFICYNEAVDDEIIGLLDKAGVQGYTKWTKVLGKGTTSGPHLYSHIWPKANNALFVVLPEELADKVFEHIRKMKNEVAAEGLKAFMWEIEEIT